VRNSGRSLAIGRWAIAAGWLVVSLAGAGRADAQTWGIKGGLNLANVNLADLKTSAKASVVAGGFYRLRLFGIPLQIEGLLAQRRIEFDDSVRDDLSFFELPVLVRYRVATGRGGQAVHVLGGGVFGARLSANEVIGEDSEDVKDLYKPADFGLAIGGEVALSRHWLVDVRYVFGLTNAYEAPDFEGKYRTFQVTVGYGW
jgi:outer membrane protein with beta-barrel domain